MILLLNDTSNYHNGCAEVIKTYDFDDSIETKFYTRAHTIDYSKYSTVILNGEGTMHHNSPTAIGFLKALRIAKEKGCDIQIHNTVWQDMTHEYDDVLKACSAITVREVLSYNQMLKHEVTPDIKPDRSLLTDVPYKEYKHVPVYKGQFFYKKYDDGIKYPRIDIFKQSWEELVNRLRHCDMLITGRHHEMYAAIKAGCPFKVYKGNSHKIEGLLITVGAINPQQSTHESYTIHGINSHSFFTSI